MTQKKFIIDGGFHTTEDSSITGNLDMTGPITTSSTVDGRDIATDGAKLDGIEAGADVTNTANVTAAGALMVSEVTNLSQVKAFDSADYATATQGTLAGTAIQPADLATVATTGSFNDLSDQPAPFDPTTLATVATTGSFNDLSDKPAGGMEGVTAGSGLTGGGASGTVTISHADTSSQASVDNSENTVIQDITLDTYGHITGINSTSITPVTVQSYTGVAGGTLNTSLNATLDFKTPSADEWGITDFGAWNGSENEYQNADSLEAIFSVDELYSFSMTAKGSGTVYTFTFNGSPINYTRAFASDFAWDKSIGSWGSTGTPADWQSYNYSYQVKSYSTESAPASEKIIRYVPQDGEFSGATASGYVPLVTRAQLRINDAVPFIGSTDLNTVGTYALLRNETGSILSPGNTVAGSSTRYSTASARITGTPSGTWRVMGYAWGGDVTIMMRIL